VNSEGFGHAPVLLEAALAALAVRGDGAYVDATYGRGGHARAILERLGADGSLLLIDRDPEAIAAARAAHGSDPRVRVASASFDQLQELVAPGSIDGFLFDLGVSSPQLDDPARGFSFLRDGPLDMRMDPSGGESAAGFLGRATEREIADVIFRYGEDRHARRIARAIVAARANAPVTTTAALAALIERAAPSRDRHKHPATRAFQALRIHVNGELEQLDAALAQALAALRVEGRIAVISFHSLEDRAVKRFLRRHSEVDPVWRGLPEVPATAEPMLELVGRAERAAADELKANPRARSATLRVARKRRA
jgi:16S rRNA (cytosine1402-N4)-methyltransferase